MAIKEDVRTRSPRGTKTVTQAFFEALDAVPDSQQKAVATAALASIRGDLKTRRLKVREAAAKAKARTPTKAKAPAGRKSKAATTAKRAPAPVQKPVAAKKAPARKTTAAKADKRKPARTVVTPPAETTTE